MSGPTLDPAVLTAYQQYLADEDSTRFIRLTGALYTFGTLERLSVHPRREVRRAAVLGLGLLGGYECNDALGKALLDEDRVVRNLAETGIRAVWLRAGNDEQRRHLGEVIRLNLSQDYGECVRLASTLLEQVPWFAEAWNQRAIACYNLGRYQDSVDDSHQALEINPYHFGAAAGMGQSYL
ncbi:MAG: tetratricopeptide repeat protein, partial [Planctomycetales bacterium]|nr:tetratricopeptide repeat protein [Planctomycetales bacterium]